MRVDFGVEILSACRSCTSRTDVCEDRTYTYIILVCIDMSFVGG